MALLVKFRMKGCHKLTCGLLVSFMMFLTSRAGATELEDLSHLQQLVQSYVKETIHVNADDNLSLVVKPLSSNVQLSRCKKELQLSFPSGLSPEKSTSLSVECFDDHGWRFYVPIQIKLLTKVVVARSRIFPGELITDNKLAYRRKDKLKFHDKYYKDKESLVGYTVSKITDEGTPITSKNIKKLALIKKNQPVTLLLKKGSLTVAMVGTAKTDGYLDEEVQVLNPSSKKIVEARTARDGTAVILY